MNRVNSSLARTRNLVRVVTVNRIWRARKIGDISLSILHFVTYISHSAHDTPVADAIGRYRCNKELHT